MVSKVGTGESQPAPASQERLTKTQRTSPYDNVHCGLRDKAGNFRAQLRRLHAFRTSFRSSRPRRANHQTRAISSARLPPIPAIHGNDQELASGA